MSRLVGRSNEIRWIDKTLANLVTEGAGACIGMVGESGIGKSSLIELVIDMAEARKVAGRVVVADEISLNRPLGVLARLLGVNSGLTSHGLPMSTDAFASAIVGGTVVPTPESVDLLASALESNIPPPSVLVIDDAHWCDRWSIVALRRLFRLARSHGVLFVLAFRPERSGSAPNGVAGLAFDRVFEPDRLGRANSLRLASTLLGRKPSGRLRSLIDLADGHPLMISELVRSAEFDHLTESSAALAGTSAPDTLAGTIRSRLVKLPPEQLELLSQCSLLGSSFPFDEALGVTGLSPEDLLNGLRALESFDLLRLEGDIARFRHPLYREVAYETTPHAVRSVWHRRLADEFEQSSPGTHLRHRLLGSRTIDDTLIRAVIDHVRAHGDHNVDASMELTELVLGASTTPELSDELIELRATLLVNTGHPAEAIQLLEAADASPKWSESRRILLATAMFLRLRHADAINDLENLLDEDLSADNRARAASLLAMLRLASGSLGLEEASMRAIGLSSGHPDSEAMARVCLSRGLACRHKFSEAAAESLRAIKVADSSDGLTAHRTVPWFFHALNQFDLDLLESTANSIRTGLKVSAAIGSDYSIPLFHGIRASLLYRQGRTDAAYAEALSGADTAEDNDALQAIVWCLSIAVMSELDRGAVDEARQLMSRAELHFATGRALLGIDFYEVARARLLMIDNEPAAALRALDDACELFEALQVSNCIPLLAPSRVRLAISLGRTNSADEVTRFVEEAASEADTPGLSAMAKWCRSIVNLDPDGLASAQDSFQQIDRISDAVDVGLDIAFVLGLAGSHDKSGSALNSALASGTEYAGRVEAMRRLLGGLGSAGSVARSGTTPVDELTGSEAEVVTLVVSGLTNAEVAHNRHVSVRTVESQLYRIYQKLGVSRRTQLMRLYLDGSVGS